MTTTELENQVQKHVVTLCKLLPLHVDRWQQALQESVKPIQNLVNLAEQLHHIQKCQLKYMDDFEHVQNNLSFFVNDALEEEIQSIKKIVDSLNQANHELKNKLTVLERSTLDLDWESDSELINGNWIQPSLNLLLQNSFKFWTFFQNHMRSISDQFKCLDTQSEKSVTSFRESFKVDLEDPAVRYLIAITQYIINPKIVI